MERLKFPKLKITFDTEYTTQPISIKFNNIVTELPQGKFFIEYQIQSIEDKVAIEFLNFISQDQQQKVYINIYHNNLQKDIHSLCQQNINKIYKNEIFILKFFKQWFECNILEGAQILNEKNLPVQWVMGYDSNSLRIDKNKKNYDIVCLGCSITYGYGLENEQTWPYILGKKTNLEIANFGTVGAGIDAILKQFFYIKKNITTKEIYILLPAFSRKRIKFYFGEEICEYLYTISSLGCNLFDKKYLEKIDREIVEQSEREGKKIIKFLENYNNVKLTSWDNRVYNTINNTKKLPKYVQGNDITDKRAKDGSHPHTEHNKHFVNLLLEHRQSTNSTL